MLRIIFAGVNNVNEADHAFFSKKLENSVQFLRGNDVGYDIGDYELGETHENLVSVPSLYEADHAILNRNSRLRELKENWACFPGQ